MLLYPVSILAAATLLLVGNPVQASYHDFNRTCIQTADRRNYDTPDNCPTVSVHQDNLVAVTENSAVTFWSWTMPRTNSTADDPLTWDLYQSHLHTTPWPAETTLTAFFNARNVSGEASGSIPCDIHSKTIAGGYKDCGADSRVDAPTYDNKIAVAKYLAANPTATSVPLGGVAFVASGGGPPPPGLPGYLTVRTPVAPPYNVTIVFSTTMVGTTDIFGVMIRIKFTVHEASAAANLDPANITPLDFLQVGVAVKSDASAASSAWPAAMALAVLSGLALNLFN
ncbi:hypothetical protein BDZ88DRAFT_455865 [Geranomyces variabilis]|nr:hypothetical protein BDZ88DRAFT_455865 [Geranomyces variabilis]KAJ3140035.1 hypothetical protein HDU90_008939 [Geranomyces variabilis]